MTIPSDEQIEAAYYACNLTSIPPSIRGSVAFERGARWGFALAASAPVAVSPVAEAQDFEQWLAQYRDLPVHEVDYEIIGRFRAQAESVRQALHWLDSALRCPTFHWDADQREMAMQALSAHPSAPVAPAEWAQCESRGPWLRNSLQARIDEMRKAEKMCRNAYKNPFMGEPTQWYADVLKDAAAVLERAYAALESTAKPPAGEQTCR